ncbi:hypothetical protein RYX56_05625 [Alkalihalophilus lindianensis]|uniref:ATP-binding protein n=1 Tax=Alkalihalophilus lindianensis TaxID=1630542 RepID=A0ABU3X7I8_9BACI|nr:hypothetical protein [Alkalihalophilus lindianensis]MDV2683788.1 hypothetical protein [Alkalihalophilus lindianensis]MDV2683854.1 hypothetical protein [Alkalihalophilus lindianensis]
MHLLKFYVRSFPDDLLVQTTTEFIDEASLLRDQFGEDFYIQVIFNSDFVSNSSLVIARAFLDFLQNEGFRYDVKGESNSFNYANRLGFFNELPHIDYDFNKQASNGRFLELETITNSDMRVTERLTKSLEEYSDRPNVFISEDSREMLSYSIGEVVSNVRRHSFSTGRISFQNYMGQTVNEVTICDCGIGIIESLRNAGNYGTDVEILKHSIQQYTSASHNPVGYAEKSPGVGLYNLCKIAERNKKASVTIVTEQYKLEVSKKNPVDNPKIIKLPTKFKGTIVVLRIPNVLQTNLNEVLEDSLQDTFF